MEQVKFFEVSLVWRFQKEFVKKICRPSPNSVFNCHNCKGTKYLKRLCLGLSQLPDKKFKRTFKNILNPFCMYDLDFETNTNFCLYCPLLVTKDTPF